MSDEAKDAEKVADTATGAAALLAGADAPAQESRAPGPVDKPSPFWADYGLATEAEAGRLSDADWMANKGFQTPADMVRAYRNLESAKGVPLPKGPDDAEGWKTLAKALGVPETADGYELKLEEGFDDRFVAAFKARAHELALLPHQVQALAEWYEAQTAADAEINAAATERALRAAWGNAYRTNLELARRGMVALDIDQNVVNALAVGLGDGERPGLFHAMQLLARIGQLTTEDTGLPGGSGTAAFTRDEAAVDARIEEIVRGEEGRLLATGRAGATLRREWEELAEAKARFARLRDLGAAA